MLFASVLTAYPSYETDVKLAPASKESRSIFVVKRCRAERWRDKYDPEGIWLDLVRIGLYSARKPALENCTST